MLNVNSSYAELAQRLAELRDQISSKEAEVSLLKEEREILQKKVLPEKMGADGMQNVTVKGVGRLSIRPDMQVSVLAENRTLLQRWLKDNGFGELVVETINSSTLKAFVKEQVNEGNDLPFDLINIHAFEQVTLTKG